MSAYLVNVPWSACLCVWSWRNWIMTI